MIFSLLVMIMEDLDKRSSVRNSPRLTDSGDESSPVNVNELASLVDELLPVLAVRLAKFVKDSPEDTVTLLQGFLLRHISSRGRCTATEIADLMGITSGPVTSLTRRMMSRELILREPDAVDRRVVWFSLTEKGRETVAALSAHSQKKWAAVIEKLGPELAMNGISLMQKTLRALSELA